MYETINSGKTPWQWLAECHDKDIMLFAISLSPAQEFINEARKGRDLRAGSLLLSYLSFKLFEPILADRKETAFIVPDIYKNPFFQEWEKNSRSLQLTNLKALAAGGKSITNRALGLIEKKRVHLLERAEANCREAWNEYTIFCKGNLQTIVGPGIWEKVWDQQMTDFSSSFNIYWVAIEIDGDKTEQNIEKVIAIMERRKDTRLFAQWQGSVLPKCIQCGRREILAGTDDELWRKLKESFLKDVIRLEDNREILCAACLAKRLFGFSNVIFPKRSIKSTPEVAAAPFLRCFQQKINLLQDKGDDDLEKMALDMWKMEIKEILSPKSMNFIPFDEHLKDIASLVLPFEQESDIKRSVLKTNKEYLFKKGDDGLGLEPPTPYLAVVMLDGDNMGRTLSQHPDISPMLTKFSNDIPGMVSDPEIQGETIYSSGDELLVLLPRDSTLSALRRIHGKFSEEISTTTCSAGITFFHCKDSLQLALQNCRDVLHHAKETYGRDSVVFSVLVASGTSYRFGTSWKFTDVSGTGFDTLSLMEELSELIKQPKGLSRRFLHDLMMELPAYVPGDPRIFFSDRNSPSNELPLTRSVMIEQLQPRLLRLWDRHIDKSLVIQPERLCNFMAALARYLPKVPNRAINFMGFLKMIDFLSR